MFHWIGVLVVVALAADFAIVAWRNRAALKIAAGAAVPSQAAGFLPVVGFGAVGVALELAKVFFGVGRTVAADTGGVVAAVINAVPQLLESLKHPAVAALVFAVVGVAVGGRLADARNTATINYGKAAIREAVFKANARADAAIKKAVEDANKRADEAIAKIKAEAARKPAAGAKSRR